MLFQVLMLRLGFFLDSKQIIGTFSSDYLEGYLPMFDIFITISLLELVFFVSNMKRLKDGMTKFNLVKA